MYILSFDCANRSLAVCLLYVNLNLINELGKKEKKYIDPVDNHVKIHMLRVFDLTKGKKVNTVRRTQLLKECLCVVDDHIISFGIKLDRVLIEYQMSANDKSRCVSNGILYHYSCIPGTLVALVGPTLKNKVCFSKDETLSHGTFMAKYASKYTANKNHSKSNFLYWLNLYGLNSILDENKIAKKNVDDIADAFMQIWGWLEFGKR